MVVLTIAVGVLSICGQQVVGRDDGGQLDVIVVGRVVFPAVSDIGEVGDEHTLVGDIQVPALLTTVFKDVVLVLVQVRIAKESKLLINFYLRWMVLRLIMV